MALGIEDVHGRIVGTDDCEACVCHDMATLLFGTAGFIGITFWINIAIAAGNFGWCCSRRVALRSFTAGNLFHCGGGLFVGSFVLGLVCFEQTPLLSSQHDVFLTADLIFGLQKSFFLADFEQPPPPLSLQQEGE